MRSKRSTHQVGRRQFLRQSVALLLGGAFAPNLICAADRPSPSNRITVGFIGTGRQAMHANIPGFLHQADAQVVAVCDVDSWRMSRARQLVEKFYADKETSGRFAGCAEISDWRDLVARRDIDAVMISTPDHWHYYQCISALKAGKDVACEKPLTRNVAEGRAIADLVKQTGRVFSTDSEFRSYRMCHQAALLVRNGKLGKLQRIVTGTPRDSTLPAQPEMPVPAELDYEMWLGPAPRAAYTEKRVHPRHDDKGRPGWLLNRDYADGMLANWGAHLNDIAMWANNTEHTGPVEVRASGKFPDQENLWNVIQEFEAIFRFENGVTLTCKTDKPYMRFEATEGWIQIDYPMKVEISDDELLLWKPGPGDVKLSSMASEKREFLDAVKARRQPQYNAEGGHRNACLSHLALASVQLGRTLKWDPVAERVIDDDEANKFLLPKPAREAWKL